MANLFVASLTQISLLLVLICWATGSTGAAFSLEEEFLQMKENYIQMKEIVRSLESKVTELTLKDFQLQEKVNELETKVQQQDSLISLLRKNNERMTATDSEIIQIGTNQTAVAINGLPSSCDDLKIIGHTLSGFYSVMGSTMMESVYCDFSKLPSDAGFQKWIGYADVKSAPVHFYVQRNSSFSAWSTPISFHLALVNEGNAMNLTSGIFTAPRPGIYFFSFTGMAGFPDSYSLPNVRVIVQLYLNGRYIGAGMVEEANTVSGQTDQVTIQSTLNLKKGDQVWLDAGFSVATFLVDSTNNHYTHFTGFMLKEEIVASL